MYELLYIVPAIYTESELTGVTNKVGELLKSEGAEIAETKNVGKLKFAYPIKKQTVGYYILVDFKAENEALKKINRALQIDNSILRFLVTKAYKSAKATKIVEFNKVDPTAKRPERRREAPLKTIEKEKIKLEDLDKKLETLLEKDIV